MACAEHVHVHQFSWGVEPGIDILLGFAKRSGALGPIFECLRPRDLQMVSHTSVCFVLFDVFFVYFPNGKSTHISGKPLSKSENMSNLRDQMMFELPLVDVKLHRASSQRFDFDQWRQLICCFGERLQPPTMSESRGITSGPQPYFL